VVATAFSAALHASLVLALISGATVAVAVQQEDNMIADLVARFLAPPNKAGGATAEKVSFVGIEVAGSPRGEPNGAPVRVTENATVGEAVRPQQIAPAIELNDLARLQIAAQAIGAFTVIEVDSAAERDPLSAAPAYPQSMLEKQVEGAAMMRFVIDSTGLIDLKTVAVQRASHPDFVRAVQEAMPRMRFRPAIMGAKPVRQLVEQEFKFQIRTPSSPLTRRP
jgi:TonB family protein